MINTLNLQRLSLVYRVNYDHQLRARLLLPQIFGTEGFHSAVSNFTGHGKSQPLLLQRTEQPPLYLHTYNIRSSILSYNCLAIFSQNASPTFLSTLAVRYFSTKPPKPTQNMAEKKSEAEQQTTEVESEEKLSLWKRFKKMYKEYWYIMIPVHCITSVGWFGGFYYMAANGIDIIPYLEYIGLGEAVTSKLKATGAGYIAVAYTLYKLATPLRYTVTLGCTTISINYFTSKGWIKPMPSKEKLKQGFQERKEQARNSIDQLRAKLQQHEDNKRNNKK